MSEWLPELVAFYQAPVAIGCMYVVVAVTLTRGNGAPVMLATVTAAAILAMFTMARPFSPPSVYLGNIPRLQESVGTAGIMAAGAVLWFRIRRTTRAQAAVLDCALGIATFLVVVLFPVAALLLMASMNPD